MVGVRNEGAELGPMSQLSQAVQEAVGSIKSCEANIFGHHSNARSPIVGTQGVEPQCEEKRKEPTALNGVQVSTCFHLKNQRKTSPATTDRSLEFAAH